MVHLLRAVKNRLLSRRRWRTRGKLGLEHLIHGDRFLRHPLSVQASKLPAMLDVPEQRILTYLAYHLASQEGKIVELGCYLGGSTTCLVDGIRQARLRCDPADPLVVSYDLFIANQFMVDHSLSDYGVQVNQSFERVFHQLLGDRSPYVRTVAGDIRRQSWSGGPIDLLFVDIIWGWDINQHVIKEFYPALIPGRSVVVHQDYIFSFYPWLPISMEYLCAEGYFELGAFAEGSTVVFGARRAVDQAALSIDFQRDLSLETKRMLLRRSADRFNGYPRALLELSEVMLLVREGRPHDAASLFEDVVQRYPDNLTALQHIAMVKGHLVAEGVLRS